MSPYYTSSQPYKIMDEVTNYIRCKPTDAFLKNNEVCPNRLSYPCFVQGRCVLTCVSSESFATAIQTNLFNKVLQLLSINKTILLSVYTFNFIYRVTIQLLSIPVIFLMKYKKYGNNVIYKVLVLFKYK